MVLVLAYPCWKAGVFMRESSITGVVIRISVHQATA